MSDSILSEQLWQRIEPLLPQPTKRRNVQHAGRKPANARKVMTGILFVLKTGVPWKNLPASSDFPSGHTCRRRLLEWHARGVWRRLWQNVLLGVAGRARGDSPGSEPWSIAPASGPVAEARRPGEAP